MTTPPNAGQEEITDLTRAITARRKAIREDLEQAMNLIVPDETDRGHILPLKNIEAWIGNHPGLRNPTGMSQQLAWRLIERALTRLDQ
jgi:hypothetical protein